MAATWGQGRAAATDKPAPATLATFGSRVCLLQTFSGEKNSDGISLSAPLFRRRSGTPRSRRILAVFRRASASLPSLGRRRSRCAAVALCCQLHAKTALELILEAQRTPVFGEEVAEGLVSEFLDVGHVVPGEQVERHVSLSNCTRLPGIGDSSRRECVAYYSAAIASSETRAHARTTST